MCSVYRCLVFTLACDLCIFTGFTEFGEVLQKLKTFVFDFDSHKERTCD